MARNTGADFRKRRLASLTAAVTDFQKAQCFFMLAICIAAQIIQTNGGFGPITVQQLYYNYTLLKSISISGYLPVTATLLTLYMIDMVSWYLLLLSACTVALSIFTFARIAHGDITTSSSDQASLLAQTGGGPSSCGGHNLTVFCLQPRPNDATLEINEGGTNVIMIPCLVVLGSIIVGKLAKVSAQYLKGSKTATNRGKGNNFLESPVRTIFCLTFLVYYLPVFGAFFRDLFWFTSLVDRTRWSFGQIIAITVWAPPLFEYFHLELRKIPFRVTPSRLGIRLKCYVYIGSTNLRESSGGMKRGFQHRLLPPYELAQGRRTESTQNANDDSPSSEDSHANDEDDGELDAPERFRKALHVSRVRSYAGSEKSRTNQSSRWEEETLYGIEEVHLEGK